MPANPERACRGGDVPGDTKTDVNGAVGSPITVANASYEPGYEIGESIEYANLADLKQGFCDYGVSIGESQGKGYIR